MGITKGPSSSTFRMQLNSEESELRRGSARFKEASPEITLHCADDARHEAYFAPGMTVPKELLHLTHIVSNPNASEKSWMNACVGAGERSLVPQLNIWGRINFGLKSTLGSILATLTYVLNCALAVFLTSEVAFLTRGISHNDFVHGFSTADAVGLLTGMAASVCFWLTLLCRKRAWWSSQIQIVVSSLTLFIIYCGTNDHLGGSLSLQLVAISLAGILLIKHFGKLCRECLPISFAAPKLAQSWISMLLVPAAFTSWLLFNAITNPSPTSDHTNGGATTLMVFGPVLGFCILGQGFALARASKSISRSACAFLSTCVQAPLLLALGMSVFISMALSFTSDSATISDLQFLSSWKSIGIERGLFLLGTIAMALGLSAGGGYLGAWANSVCRKN